MSVDPSITDKLTDLHSKLKLNYVNFSEGISRARNVCNVY